MTMERLLRALSDAGFLRKGSAGRRLHFIAHEIAHILLGQAAGSPSDAPNIVRVLAELRADDNGERLVDWLTSEIKWAATPEGAAVIRSEMTLWDDKGVVARDLTLCAGPSPYAWISTRRADASGRDLRSFHPADRPLISGPAPIVRHMTTIGLGLILVAGELFADTLARRPAPTLIPDPAPGSAGEGNTSPETTKAAGPGSPNGLQSELSALARRTAPFDKVQSNAGEGGGQPHLSPPARESRTSQPVRPPINSHRSAAHGPHWNDAAAP